MKRILILFYLILIISCTHKTPSTVVIGNDTLIKVLTYGYPPVDYYQRNKIAKKYGYSIISVAGCSVNQQLIDSVQKVDEIAYKAIEKINGKGWQDRFEIDVTNEFRRDSIIINEIEELDFIKEKDKELRQSNNGLSFYIDSILDNGTYQVNVSGYDVTTVSYENINGYHVPSADYVSYFRVYYNYNKHKVDSVHNKVLFIFRGK